MTSNIEEADLILVNTCSIREKAEHKLYSLLGRLKPLRKNKPHLKIGVTGCVAQQLGGNLFKKAPFVDMVIGPQCIYNIAEVIDSLSEAQGRVVATTLSPNFQIPAAPRAPLPGRSTVRAFVTIMQGCDNFCTYCIVPFVRGREVSRPAQDILKEIDNLVKQGVKDITLLGQNVNSYGKGLMSKTDFPGLLTMIDKNFPDLRLRFTTSHPKDLSDDLISCFSDLKTLCEHLHLPVQAGSDQVLRRMNRKYTVESYMEKVQKLRKSCPEICLTTDIIAGFPGETDQDFQGTMELLRKIRFDQIFAFKYSERPGTAAAGFDDKIPEEKRKERLAQILELQNAIGLEQYKRYENRILECLVESSSNRGLQARTRGNHVVNLTGDDQLIGQVLDIFIEKACHHSLKGRIVN
ncbi:MAG: tRNA (N6-isopentenyl adenosine(37)-C2)-methylthiotransferase MiaB [Thermodesulfatator sp.]|nr:MAG: tRNA (N6-isopentenyl adenosine(37)-C2)-methylthiotransferase MiaB [Thermodesulfatator sp.]